MYEIAENKDESVTLFLDGDEVATFLPETDLDESLRLLEIFNNISTTDGRKIYEIWQSRGFWYYSAFQEWLYWDFFVGVVQHKKVREYLRSKRTRFLVPPYYVNGRLRRVQSALYKRHSIFQKILLNAFCGLNRIFRSAAAVDVLIFDDGKDGFRYGYLKNVLRSLNVDYLRVEYPTATNFLSLFVRRGVFPAGGKKIRSRIRNISFDYSKIGELSDYVTEDEFGALINAINERCQNAIYETELAIKDLKVKKPKIFITYDQIERVIPLVVACRLREIKVVAYQHGPLTKFHAGWLGCGIPNRFCNIVPDQLVTWGSYWREYLCSHSNKYTLQSTVVGAHLNKRISYESFSRFYDSKRLEEIDEGRLKILVPFEFLADNISISRYLEIFLDYGWLVCVKLRPSEGLETESDKYAFSKKVRERAIFVDNLSDTELSTFHAVVCTQSVFAVEMMRFSVPIWFLYTSVRFLENIVEAGIAHPVTLTDVKNFDQKNLLRPLLKPMYTQSHYRQLFSDTSMTEFLSGELQDISQKT